MCRDLISKIMKLGGVLTINWHQRSLGPERFWEDLYRRILGALREHRVWYATGAQAVGWYRKRRDIQFTQDSLSENTVTVSLNGNGPDAVLPMRVLVHSPSRGRESGEGGAVDSCREIIWEGEQSLELTL